MSTYPQIVKQLSGDSLKEYHAAMKYLCDTVRAGKLEWPLDQEIMERAAAIHIWEKWSDWTETTEMIEQVMDVLPHHAYLFADFNDRNLLGGIAMFIENLNSRKIYTDAFFWIFIQGGQIANVALECERLAAKIEANNEDHAAIMRRAHDTLKMIADAKTELFYMLDGLPGRWTKQMTDGVYNILVECESEGLNSILQALSYSKDDQVIKDMVLGRYLGLIRSIRDKYTEEGNTEMAQGAEDLIKSVSKQFSDEDGDDESESTYKDDGKVDRFVGELSKWFLNDKKEAQ